MSAYLDNLTPGRIVAIIIGGAVMLVIWILNAIFTFSYGYEAVGPFLLINQLGPDMSATLSGIVAFLFFDAAYTVAFITLLFACDSVWQYGIVALQFVICFILSIVSSAVAILLLSPLGETVSPVLLEATRYIGYAGLLAGFIINATAAVGYIVAMPSMSESITNSIRKAGELATTKRANDKLDKESRRLAVSSIEQQIPGLAEKRANALLLSYLASLGNLQPSRNGNGQHTAGQPTQLAATGNTGTFYVREADGSYTEVAPEPQRPPQPGR